MQPTSEMCQMYGPYELSAQAISVL
jgi:hypothetical protein